MQRYTNRALLISLGVHLILVLTIVPLLRNDASESKDSVSLVLLETQPVQQVKKRVFRQRHPRMRQVRRTKALAPSRASSTNTMQGPAPKAEIPLELTPDLVTNADIPETGAPALPNASLGKEVTGLGREAVGIGRGTGVEGPRQERGNGLGHRFANGTGVDDLGLGNFDGTSTGLGIFDTVVMPGHGLVGTVYVPGTPIYRLPAFERLTPVHTFITANLNVAPRNYTEGFPTPKMQSVVENFAIRFRGKLAIKIPGKYTFTLNADDGAQLYINRKLVVNNDGIHPPQRRQGSLKLTAGMHNIEIHYFQGPRHQIALQWLYRPPKGKRQIVPPEMIYLPDTPHVPKSLRKLQDRMKKIQN